MKTFRIFHVLFLLLLVFSSCYDDKSSVAGTPIEAVVIDTTGMGTKDIYIGYQEELTLAPKVQNTAGSQLSYQWSISAKTNSDRDTTMNVIGHDLALNYKVERPISSSFYRLRLTVTDRSHGNLQYFCSWDVYVQSAFVSGLLIADSKVEGTTDFTYVKNKSFTPKHTKDEVIIKNILADGSAGAIKGTVSSLHYSAFGWQWLGRHTRQVWATTKEGTVTRYDSKDFTLNGNSEDKTLIPYKPSGFKFNYFFKGGADLYANTSHGNYSLEALNANSFSLPNAVIGNVKFNNNVVATSTNSSAYYDNVVWLEDATGVLSSYTRGSSGSFEIGTFTSVPNAFDPNNLKGKKALAAEIAADMKTFVFLLKDNTTNQSAIYQLNVSTSSSRGTAKGLYRIPSAFQATMDKAVSYFFSKRENILYVVTETGVYALSFGLREEAVVLNSASPIYSLPAGEKIHKAKLYKQGQYVANAMEVDYNYLKMTFPYNLNAIILMADKSGEGVVRVLPLTNNGTGADTENVHVYGGFGKVLDVISIGQ